MCVFVVYTLSHLFAYQFLSPGFEPSLVHLVSSVMLRWHTVSTHLTHIYLCLLLQDTFTIANIGCSLSFSVMSSETNAFFENELFLLESL